MDALSPHQALCAACVTHLQVKQISSLQLLGPGLAQDPDFGVLHMLRAAKLTAYSGVSSIEWMQLEPAFPGARVGWERGGTLMAMSPQVSMPAQTCWQAGCPPCCCCGTIACPCSSPCTGEHSPTTLVSQHNTH